MLYMFNNKIVVISKFLSKQYFINLFLQAQI